MSVRFGSSPSINSSNEIFGYESLPLSSVCLIEDGTFRFFHIVREEGASHDNMQS